MDEERLRARDGAVDGLGEERSRVSSPDSVLKTAAHDQDAASGHPPDSETGLLWQLGILLASSLYAPLQVWADSTEQAGVFGFLLIGAVIFLTGLAGRSLLVTVGLDSLGSTYAVAVVTLCFFSSGTLIGRPFGRWFLVLLCLAIGVIVYGLRKMHVFRLAIAWGALALLAYPLLLWASQIGGSGSDSQIQADPITAQLSAPPRDVLVLVVDGYAGSSVLSELYGYDNQAFFDRLDGHGFDVTEDVVANYGRTRLSVPSALQLGYPAEETMFSSGDLNRLLEIIGGDNVMANWLERSGYRHIYVESGWFGTRCGKGVDVCVRAPWPDESLFDVTYRSLLRDAPGFETGRSFSVGAQHAIEWLQTDLHGFLSDDTPDYIYVHVLAPHPPLFLDPACEMNAGEGYKGFSIGHPGMSDAELHDARKWYVDQVQCVNSVLVEVAASVEASNSVALIFGESEPKRVEAVLSVCAEQGKTVRIAMDSITPTALRGRMEEYNGIPMWSVLATPEYRLELALKRIVDVVGSTAALVLLSPLLLVTALAILIVDGRPVLYRQQRGGHHGRHFPMLKFRTMVNGAESIRADLLGRNERTGPVFKIADDPRITRLGRWLRRSSLDESPQLLNVIAGQMSLVGPRPQPLEEVAEYDLWHRRRMSMRPGITGLWQVNARHDPSFDTWMDYDLEYIDRWSLWLDLSILAKTPGAVIKSPGV